MLLPDELVVDNFASGGGASAGMERETKIAEAIEWLSYIPLHVKNESHHGGHIMHFLNNATRCLEKVKE